MSTRAELTTIVQDLLEDYAQDTFDKTQIHSALNRAAEHLTRLFARLPMAFFTREKYDFATTGEKSYTITGGHRIAGPDCLRRIDLNRDAIFVDETQIASPEYSSGRDGIGRVVAYLTYDPTAFTNEVQTATITGTPTGGTFTLSYGGQVTSGIAYNASAATVQAALLALSTIPVGSVTVTGSAPAYTITFGGRLGKQALSLIVASGAGLTGGSSPAVAIARVTAGSHTMYSVNFVVARGAGESWRFFATKKALSFSPDDTDDDDKSYDSLPPESDDLVAYRAALILLGKHEEDQAAIARDFADLLGEAQRAYRLPRASGRVVQRLWRQYG